MKPRLPTREELRQWRESNRFTTVKDGMAGEEDEVFAEVLNNPSPTRGEDGRGAVRGTKVAPNAPTPALPLQGREKAPLKPLHPREARRVLNAAPAVEATLDLHGYTKLTAHERVQHFIRTSRAAGRRHVVIITGKGRTGDGVLRKELPHWLNEPALRPLISALAPARPEKGGAGVLHVLLKRHP